MLLLVRSHDFPVNHVVLHLWTRTRTQYITWLIVGVQKMFIKMKGVVFYFQGHFQLSYTVS